MSGLISSRGVMAAVLAAVAATATDGVYVALIISQNSPGPPGVVPFITVYIAAIACAAVVAVALILQAKTAAAWALLVSATAACAVLGFLGLFSIGIALLITAGLLGVAAFRLEQNFPTSISRLPALIGSAIAIAILIAGFIASHVFWGA